MACTAANAPGRRHPHELLAAADLVRVGLAGSIASHRLQRGMARHERLSSIDYGTPLATHLEPGEVVSDVENHDNQTLWDANAFKLPKPASPAAHNGPVCRC